jgi:ABC-type lipoprotein release transport system permease subunit
MFAVLGPVLLGLAAIGIYAVVSYGVSLRGPEIGVRLALGAPVARVVWSLVADSFAAALLGAAGGWALALVVSRDMLTDRELDWAVFGVIPALLLGVVWLASWLPARRATVMDPLAVLRE